MARPLLWGPTDMNDQSQPTGRRAVLGGAAVAGGLAAVASLLPEQKAADVTPALQAQTTATDTKGYQLSEHVKRYYATARI